MCKHIFIIGLLLVLCLHYQAQAVDVNSNHAPVVTNVVAEQVDFEHVLIRYDVEDADGDTMTVSVKVSACQKARARLASKRLLHHHRRGYLLGWTQCIR